MSSSYCTDEYAQTNPDISGVGVRISFYLQTFLLVLLVDRSWQDAPIALWTFIATSFGITLAAIIQREQLTLFQALQVSNLVWLANFGILVALASYSRQKAASLETEEAPTTTERARIKFDYKVKYGAMAQTLFSMMLTLYMWSKARTFGNQPECSHLVKYMFFVIEVSAIETGRIVALSISSLLTLGYILISLHEVLSFHRNKRHSGNEDNKRGSHFIKENKQPSSLSVIPTPMLPNSLASSCSCRMMTGSLSMPGIIPERARVHELHCYFSRHNRPRRRRWSFDLDPMFIGIVNCQILVFVYFVVSSELLLQRNPSLNSNDGQWGFGQILALIVVLPSGLAVMEAFTKHGLKRLSKGRINNNH